MQLEQQVVSLELAKKLKMLGVTKESYFKWVTNGFPEGAAGRKWIVVRSQQFQEGFDAFTVAELGEMLPDNAFSWRSRVNGDWACGDDEDNAITQRADTEADARAAMLVYLIENKLITL